MDKSALNLIHKLISSKAMSQGIKKATASPVPRFEYHLIARDQILCRTRNLLKTILYNISVLSKTQPHYHAPNI